MEKIARQRQGVCVLGAALFAVWLASCESSCPPGFTKVDNRCHSPKMDELATSETDAAVDASAGAGQKPKTTGTGAREKDAGMPRSSVGSGGSGGSSGSGGQASRPREDAGTSGTGGRGGQTPNHDAGPDAPVEPSTPDVCKGKNSGSVCDGANMHHCAAGSTEGMDSCMDAELCQIGLPSNACAVCAPGTFRCDDARLDVCDDAGQFKLLDTCATAALCKETAGACTDMLCRPDAVSCSSDRSTLNTCNADGSGFADQRSCEDKGCDQANLRCNACKPGERVCSGDDTLLSCNADGQTMGMTRCEPSDDNGCRTSTCRGSACVPGQKQLGAACPAGKCNLSGDCVQCIQAADCPAVDACHSRSCDARGSCQQQTQPDGTNCGDNKRCTQGKCEALPKTVALTSYWSAMRNDNFTTGTAAGEADAIAAGYSRVRVEGYAFEAQQPGTVPLRSFWSAMRNDNFTTGTAAGAADARAANYASVRTEGYAYETQQPGTVALKLYWSAMRNDNFTTATQAGEDDAVAAGYDYVRIEAWVLTQPNP